MTNEQEKQQWEDAFSLADSAIEQAYPNIYGLERGMWGHQPIPNFGILRGSIAEIIRNSKQSSQLIIDAKDKELAEVRAELVAEKIRLARGEYGQICGFCGWETKPEGASWEELEAHILTCDKHPAATLRKENAELRKQLENYMKLREAFRLYRMGVVTIEAVNDAMLSAAPKGD